MPKGVLAVTKDGRLTYCTASEENRGSGRCNHIAHKYEHETVEDFLARASVPPENMYKRSKADFDTILRIFDDQLTVLDLEEPIKIKAL